jgi:hypothetical protein
MSRRILHSILMLFYFFYILILFFLSFSIFVFYYCEVCKKEIGESDVDFAKHCENCEWDYHIECSHDCGNAKCYRICPNQECSLYCPDPYCGGMFILSFFSFFFCLYLFVGLNDMDMDE